MQNDKPESTDYRPTVTSTVPCPITGNLQCGEPFCQHEDGRCYLRDELDRANATAWQPIETYPIVTVIGHPALLYDALHKVYVGEWRWTCWVSVPGTYVRKPTHWMPLPEPPECADGK